MTSHPYYLNPIITWVLGLFIFIEYMIYDNTSDDQVTFSD